MIGRADIEGSKSNVAMNAWLPQASYPCVGFPLSVPVLSRLFDARGRDPEGPVPSPSPRPARGDPLSPREQLEQSTDSRRVRTGTPVPSPQSQSFSRGYGSILPTSLAYIVPSTRGCSPWRPDAVMSTTGVIGTRSSGFSRPPGRTGHHATSAPTAAPPGLAPQVSAVRHRNPLPVHPASPVLLTKNGPLGALDSVARLNRAAAPSYPLKFENRSRALRPDASNHWLYLIELEQSSSYPEGNFGGNQLLDGSLFPFAPIPKSDERLHVSIAAGLHQSFLWLRPAQA
ncbi:hypothetical protein L6164_037939 [Bauhinia variegata]|nr:hypothetical protein L6164_037939 [Bauhinia variegata]